jgi:hypothetical protein
VLGFASDEADVAATASGIAELARTRLRRMVVTAIDGADPATTALGRAMLASGFAASYRGLAAR